MKRNLVLLTSLIVSAAVGLGCGKDKQDPKAKQALIDLRGCEEQLAEKNALIDKLNARNAELEGQTGEFVVRIEGDVVEVVGRVARGSGTPAAPNAKETELAEAFIQAVKRSRGSIKKCYENALKKDQKLQARTVTLSIDVNYKTSGQVSDARFSPRISETFDRCMDGVAKNWTLPKMAAGASFQAKQTLTPQ